MPKFEIKATELTDTDVNFVALVKRGANRIPFRVTKGETDMIDLHKIGRTLFKKADPAPAIVALVTQKSDIDPGYLLAVTKAAGLKGLKKSEKDGLITFAKADAPTEGVFLIKLDENIALAVANSQLQKGFSGYDFSSTDFKDVVGTNGFCDGLSLASDALEDTVSNILCQSDDPGTARDKINQAIEDYKAYVDALCGSIPVQAFKADQALVKMKKAAAGNGGASGGTDDDEETGDGMGDGANGGKNTTMKASSEGKTLEDEGDPGAKDPLMPTKKAAQTSNPKTQQVNSPGSAGVNGTGAGAEMGQDTGTNPRATADDAENTEVNAKPGGKTSGNDSGMPAGAKAPTKKNDLRFDPDKDGDDDTIMTGESAAGEGAAQEPTDSRAATARATADDQRGSKNTGRPGADTMDHAGIPARAMAPTMKNDGDGEIGKKGKGNELEDQLSGAGAQEKDVQTLKGDQIMQAVQSLAKSVQDGLAAVGKRMDGIEASAKNAFALAQKTDAALNGTVFNDAGDDAPVRTQKAEGRSAPPLLDTAYSRRTA